MKTKIAIFDFDGTLTESKPGGNCWRYVWERINKPNIDDCLYKAYLAGEIDYDEWSRRVLQVYRDSLVDKAMLKEIASTIKLRDGVKQTFEILKQNKIKIYILSGGIKSIIEDVLKECKGLIYAIEAQDFEFDENGVVKTQITENVENKYNFIIGLKSLQNIKGQEIFFVGNDYNDESVHGAGVRTLCVNPDNTNPQDKRYWDFYIENLQNFQEILPFIE